MPALILKARPMRGTPVLVAVVTRRKDWALLQNEHWYRIPVRTAPESIERFKWLAFYQTRVFGNEKWAVNWYARVVRASRVRRIDLLPDEPSHPRALDEYFRLDVGRLERLPRPVPSARLRRIVFIPTTLGRLKRAREIRGLFGPNAGTYDRKRTPRNAAAPRRRKRPR